MHSLRVIQQRTGDRHVAVALAHHIEARSVVGKPSSCAGEANPEVSPLRSELHSPLVVGVVLRQVRSAVLEELNKEYVQGARARGVSESVILWKNVMKAAMLTIMTLLALSIGSLLGGTAIIESIFMWDGVGKLAVDAINMRDYPLIQAYVMWMAIIYVFVNLTADLLYHYFDPRIRLGGSAK